MIRKVEISGVDTSNLQALSNEERNELLKKLKHGDLEAREKFINGNLRLVLSVIQRFYNKGENVDDLFQVGCIGLIKAIDNFDMSQNVQFSTYAVPMIIGEIRRYLRDNNSIRVSRSIRDLAYKALGVKEKIYKEEQREATIEEPAYSENTENIYIIDQVKDKKNTDELWTQNITIAESMKRLNEKERMIINKRFFEGRTQIEVAEEIGISQAQVSRLERTAINHIKRIYK